MKSNCRELRAFTEACGTQMRGRSLPIEVFPLSFPEYLRFNGILNDVPKAGFTAREKGVLRKAMSDYAERGGFPDVQDVSSGMRAAMLRHDFRVFQAAMRHSGSLWLW